MRQYCINQIFRRPGVGRDPVASKRFKLCCAFIVATFIVISLPCTANLQTKLNSFHSLTANFTQTIILNGNPHITTGKLWLQKPNQFRWQQEKPSKHLYVSNGKTIWDYSTNLMQVIVRPMTKQLEQTPLFLLSGKNIDLAKLFTMTNLGPDTYQLIPTQKGGLLRKITLTFIGKRPGTMLFTNAAGQVSTVVFAHVRLNQILSKSLFKFVAPQGVDIVQ